jgi:pimeloyl-ACP methyl ester carboxylesterase
LRHSPALSALAALLVAFLPAARAAPGPAGALRADVVFDAVTPLSGNAQIVRRMLSPLAAAAIPGAAARLGKPLAEQPIDPRQERFAVYVPARAPAAGYGLLVFVPPWDEAALPPGWAPVLDRDGVIFASAARSGNEASPLSRREPLALIAAANLIARYHVDPARVWVGGFSGGSRVAMRLALGYPDLFRGALLNDGSDPIGEGRVPLPPRDLFETFQARTRLVYATGAKDAGVLAEDEASMSSMRRSCVFGLVSQIEALTGHRVLDSGRLARALDALDAPARPGPARLAACRAGLEADLAAKFQQVGALVAAGRRSEARALLTRIDQRFGGLAAPRSVDLAGQLP